MKKKIIFLTLSISILFSCNRKNEELKLQNDILTNKISKLENIIDSLNLLPTVKFEKIAIKDKILDSILDLKNQKYVKDLNLNYLKTKDSIISSEYLNFAKENKKSILSLLAFQRIKNIDFKQSMISYNQLNGKWKLDSISGICFNEDYKTKTSEEIIFTKDKKIKFIKNNKLIKESKFYLKYSRLWGAELHFLEKKAPLYINIKENGILSLSRFAIGAGTKNYERVK
ncbi:hypothetical protein [Wenyingzhuangia sp. 2_MG-2023]|uniref:hypothetical protein n=1 Tax=Wenyingzhuangia sp. 2_MG-2023 TaxID=3062639 RepID=UPI0026E420AF|nr:hypothetical protein [Wenyingzhuangia sp. 2_MG-2023]MDO6739427.1 hypothetical protein [Wenyingzhuangia sp. 2_MG-2023]MDO6803950.1 hypothetical protein [Wenyingzhuangia sp. 1_MG-2023]